MTKKETHKQDIVPISASLMRKKYRHIVSLYMDFAAMVKSITDDPKFTSIQKIQKLSDIEDVFMEEKESDGKYDLIVELKKNFVKELMAPVLVKDVIASAKKDAANSEYQTWGQLVDYCSHYAGTIGRFILSLAEENPATYQPALSLCDAYQMLNILKNTRYYADTLKRVYIPSEMLKEYGVKVRDLAQKESSKELKKLKAEMLKSIKRMLKEAEILPCIIKDVQLRMNVCMTLSAANLLYRKVKKADILKKEVRLTKFDLYNAKLTGMIEGMLTSYRKVCAQGLKK